MTQRTFTTTTPDGVEHRINTDQSYEYATAYSASGVAWVVLQWHANEALAIEAQEWMAKGDFEVVILAAWDADDDEEGIK